MTEFSLSQNENGYLLSLTYSLYDCTPTVKRSERLFESKAKAKGYFAGSINSLLSLNLELFYRKATEVKNQIEQSKSRRLPSLSLKFLELYRQLEKLNNQYESNSSNPFFQCSLINNRIPLFKAIVDTKNDWSYLLYHITEDMKKQSNIMLKVIKSYRND